MSFSDVFTLVCFLNGVCLDGMPMKKRGHIYSLEDIRESNGPDSTVKIVCETQIYVCLKKQEPCGLNQ